MGLTVGVAARTENHSPDMLTFLLLQFLSHLMMPTIPLVCLSKSCFSLEPEWSFWNRYGTALPVYTTSIAPQRLPGRVLKILMGPFPTWPQTTLPASSAATPNQHPPHWTLDISQRTMRHHATQPGSPCFPLSGRPSQAPIPTLPVQSAFRSIAPVLLCFRLHTSLHLPRILSSFPQAELRILSSIFLCVS